MKSRTQSKADLKRMQHELAVARETGIAPKKKKGIRFWFVNNDTVKCPDGTVISRAEYDASRKILGSELGLPADRDKPSWYDKADEDSKELTDITVEVIPGSKPIIDEPDYDNDIFISKDPGCMPLGTNPDEVIRKRDGISEPIPKLTYPDGEPIERSNKTGRKKTIVERIEGFFKAPETKEEFLNEMVFGGEQPVVHNPNIENMTSGERHTEFNREIFSRLNTNRL